MLDKKPHLLIVWQKKIKRKCCIKLKEGLNIGLSFDLDEKKIDDEMSIQPIPQPIDINSELVQLVRMI